MSRLPMFAQGVQFRVDTTPDSPPEQDFSHSYQWERPRFSSSNCPRGEPSGNLRESTWIPNSRGAFRNYVPSQRFDQGPPGRARGPRSWAPRRMNFSNPYEKQLTPRNYAPRQQRWQHTFRGGRAPLSTDFGPCASGATAETLAIIDAFVKPSMLEDPWKSFENTNNAPPSKKVRNKPDETAEPTCSPSTSQDWQADAVQNTSNDDVEFNLKDFIPKV